MRNYLLCAVVTIALLVTKPAGAYDEKVAHRAINAAVVENSTRFSEVLRQVELSVNMLVNGKEIKEWFREGGTKEDAAPRWLNHFHDPTKAWSVAGLKGERVSSVLWAQQEYQDAWNTWSWPQAHTFYLEGLTAATPDEREKSLAKTFRALGQILHLLADSAVPAHVRDDLHPMGEPYELYCKNHIRVIPLAAPSIGTAITYHSLVPGLTPISNFWDTTPEPGANPNPEGLAEYTNRNFFSRDTIFKGYAYPAKAVSDALPLWLDEVTAADGQVDYRIYFSDVTSDQKTIKHSASTGYLWSELQKTAPKDVDDGRFVLDDECFKEYAGHLLPKAVAYGTALLDYFFRGQIDMVADPGNPGQYMIKNESDEELSGTFALYYDDNNDNRKPVSGAEWPLSIAAKGASSPVAFTAPNDAKEAGKYMLVFQGRMGQEVGAVVGRSVELQQEHSFLLIRQTSITSTEKEIGGENNEDFYDQVSWQGKYFSGRFSMIDYSLLSGEWELKWIGKPQNIVKISIGKIHSRVYCSYTELYNSVDDSQNIKVVEPTQTKSGYIYLTDTILFGPDNFLKITTFDGESENNFYEPLFIPYGYIYSQRIFDNGMTFWNIVSRYIVSGIDSYFLSNICVDKFPAYYYIEDLEPQEAFISKTNPTNYGFGYRKTSSNGQFLIYASEYFEDSLSHKPATPLPLFPAEKRFGTIHRIWSQKTRDYLESTGFDPSELPTWDLEFEYWDTPYRP